MKQHWRSVVMIVVGGAFAPLGAAMSLTQSEPTTGILVSLFGFAVLVTGIATFRTDDAPWRRYVLLTGGLILGVVCLVIVLQMLSPDSPLWESRRATGLFWASVAGVFLFLVGGVVALVVSARTDLRNRE
jgi:hypothetical protein